MDDDPKQIDLSRRDYRAEGISGEPLFGAGWPFGAAVLVMIVIGTLIHDASGPIYFFGAIAGAVLAGLIQKIYR